MPITSSPSNHFITFSESPRIVEIKSGDIIEKARYCNTFNEIANTTLEAVFLLILNAAKKYRVSKKEIPSKIYIISDMQFNYCIVGGNDEPMFRKMRSLFKAKGYELPDIVF